MNLSPLEPGELPRVILAVDDSAPMAEVREAVEAGVHAVELRVDNFRDHSVDHVVREAQRYEEIPTLGTIRCEWEGGNWRKSEVERRELFLALMPHVSAIDVELSAEEILGDIVAACRRAGKSVIGSFHDFKSTPSAEELHALRVRAQEAGVDAVKAACCCNDYDDLQRLATFTLDASATPGIAIGMGPAGTLSRIFFPALGSRFTYTFLGRPTAPGQLNWQATLEYLLAFYT